MTEVTDASLIAEALTDYYGPRCPGFEPECHCCKAWAQFDALAARPEPKGVEEALAAKYPAEAVIEGDNIVIRIPTAAIPVAFEAWPDAPRNDEADPLYRVTDAATFAKGIVRYLNDESEDGTTRIHLMLDSAMNEALEQGEEGVEEIAIIRARGGSDD